MSDAPTSIKELYKLTRLLESTTLYKSMKPKQINILEEKVSQVTEIIKQEYENSFSIHVDKEKLVNVISGGALNDDIAESILNMVDVGKLRKIRITKKDRSVKVAEVNRNILRAFNFYSLRTGNPVDFKKALSYSLSPLPLSISNLIELFDKQESTN